MMCIRSEMPDVPVRQSLNNLQTSPLSSLLAKFWTMLGGKSVVILFQMCTEPYLMPCTAQTKRAVYCGSMAIVHNLLHRHMNEQNKD